MSLKDYLHDHIQTLMPQLPARVRCGLCYSSVIDPVIIAESGRFQSGERRPSAQRGADTQGRLSRSRCSSRESLASEEREEVRERVTHSEPRIIEVSRHGRALSLGRDASLNNHQANWSVARHKCRSLIVLVCVINLM